MTMESMEWYGTVHMDSMDYYMNSIWNGMEQSIWNGTFSKKFTKSNMESMFIPWTGFHGLHRLDSMDSTWNPYGMMTQAGKN